MTVGTFATGSEHVPPLKTWTCPVHGTLDASQVVPTATGRDYHAGCGKWVHLTNPPRGERD